MWMLLVSIAAIAHEKAVNRTLGEPEFVERMQRTYQDKAAANHVTIVHSCGFDSVMSFTSNANQWA